MLGKNKIVTSVLLIVVGIIWINVLLKLFNNLTADNTDNSYDSFNSSAINLPLPESRNFELICAYRDPFLNKSTHSTTIDNNSSPTNTNSIASPIQIPSPITTPWPKIYYYGFVRQSNNEKAMGLLKVDGATLNLRAGDRFYEEYSIESIYRDSLVVKRGKSERKTYSR
jgi:hypothetical protein